MTGVFRCRANSSTAWYRGRAELSNQHCLYCARFVGEGSDVPSNKEHLIGKRFVPPSTLGTRGAFNFLFRACCDCNLEKSNIEGHVSAVSLIFSTARDADSDIDALARHKAEGQYDSTKPGTLVADAGHEATIKLGSVLSVTLMGPAQFDPNYVRLLALRHVQGLFALVTSKNPTVAESTRLLPEAHFGLFGYYVSSDWGNPQLVEIAKRVEHWPAAVQVNTAAGYFRAVLRRQSDVDSPWFWALEWNKGVRVIGWIGTPTAPPTPFLDLPYLRWRTLKRAGHLTQRIRNETPLAAEDDVLFRFDDT